MVLDKNFRSAYSLAACFGYCDVLWDIGPGGLYVLLAGVNAAAAVLAKHR